jgi:hypothetical protein
MVSELDSTFDCGRIPAHVQMCSKPGLFCTYIKQVSQATGIRCFNLVFPKKSAGTIAA